MTKKEILLKNAGLKKFFTKPVYSGIVDNKPGIVGFHDPTKGYFLGRRMSGAKIGLTGLAVAGVGYGVKKYLDKKKEQENY